jgi:FkbM family methyltransferase
MDKLFKYINPKRVLDIGANVGDFSKKIYFRFPKCDIIMIEANPNCKPYLQLLEIPYQLIGVSDKKGSKDFFIEKSNIIATGSSFYKENTEFYSDDKYDVVKIETETLDNLNFFSEQIIDLIKIDVQGSELDILIGGEKTIKKSNYVLMELSLLEYNLRSPLIEKVFDRMINYGFFVKDILEYHRLPSLYDGLVFQIDIFFKNNNI